MPISMVQPPREAMRLVKAPAETITLIHESEEEDVDDDTPTRTISTRQPSVSRLPLPRFVPTPQPAVLVGQTTMPHINLTTGPGATKRKQGRRNSARLNVEHLSAVERAPSPILGPVRRLRRSSTERDDEEREVELEVQVGVEPEAEVEQQGVTKIKDEDSGELGKAWVMAWPKQSDGKGKRKQVITDKERDPDIHSTSEKDSSEGTKEWGKEKEKRRCGIKDVTNSPRKGVTEFAEEKSVDRTSE